MSKLPAITGKQAIRAFRKIGFEVDRQQGSHVILKKPGFQYALSIPDWGKKTISRGVLRRQIQLAGLSVQEFIELL